MAVVHFNQLSQEAEYSEWKRGEPAYSQQAFPFAIVKFLWYDQRTTWGRTDKWTIYEVLQQLMQFFYFVRILHFQSSQNA